MGSDKPGTCSFIDDCVMQDGRYSLMTKPSCRKYCQGYTGKRSGLCPVYDTYVKNMLLTAKSGLEALGVEMKKVEMTLDRTLGTFTLQDSSESGENDQ